MTIAKTYSHLNGEEYLIVHHNDLYQEIKEVIKSIDANKYLTKISKETRKMGHSLYSPKELNAAFEKKFSRRNWKKSRYDYYITLDRELMELSLTMPAKEQKQFLIERGERDFFSSYTETDFVKDKIAVEIQFGKYTFIAYDLFVKHMMFYSGNVINLGVEILPTKELQSKMSSGPAYFEREVYHVMRQGRNSPPVPLLILGVEP